MSSPPPPSFSFGSSSFNTQNTRAKRGRSNSVCSVPTHSHSLSHSHPSSSSSSCCYSVTSVGSSSSSSSSSPPPLPFGLPSTAAAAPIRYRLSRARSFSLSPFERPGKVGVNPTREASNDLDFELLRNWKKFCIASGLAKDPPEESSRDPHSTSTSSSPSSSFSAGASPPHSHSPLLSSSEVPLVSPFTKSSLPLPSNSKSISPNSSPPIIPTVASSMVRHRYLSTKRISMPNFPPSLDLRSKTTRAIRHPPATSHDDPNSNPCPPSNPPSSNRSFSLSSSRSLSSYSHSQSVFGGHLIESIPESKSAQPSVSSSAFASLKASRKTKRSHSLSPPRRFSVSASSSISLAAPRCLFESSPSSMDPSQTQSKRINRSKARASTSEPSEKAGESSGSSSCHFLINIEDVSSDDDQDGDTQESHPAPASSPCNANREAREPLEGTPSSLPPSQTSRQDDSSASRGLKLSPEDLLHLATEAVQAWEANRLDRQTEEREDAHNSQTGPGQSKGDPLIS